MARRSKASAQSTTRAQRAAVVMEKKGKCWSFEQIGDFLGITKQAAHAIYWEERAAWAAMKHEHQEELDAHRDDDLEILRQIIQAWLPDATGTAVDAEGKPLPKSDKAAAIVHKSLERKSKLLGTDAPVRNDITSNGETLTSVQASYTVPVVMSMEEWTAQSRASAEADAKAAEALLNEGSSDETSSA